MALLAGTARGLTVALIGKAGERRGVIRLGVAVLNERQPTSSSLSLQLSMAAYPRIAEDNLHVALEYSYLNQGPLDGNCAMDFQPSCQLPYGDMGPCSGQAYRYSSSPMARSYSAPPSASMSSPSTACGIMSSRPRHHLHPEHPSSMVHHGPTTHFPGLSATQGLFWDGTRHFEPRSDDEDDTGVGTPSPSFHATPTGGRLAISYDLERNRP
ncbi:hypothetical protein AVEN_252456-1 [Araneus ventricosus]|uniref:Uncharacterized protein n=2 Tax=Araneidae TaxID=6913 RepID=A0A4Y2AS16_ARAVE|nr:hypothetical protein AVEN_252456-1 [Araneus ventricosus]